MLDEMEIAKQLQAYGYSVKLGYPLAHQSITKLSHMLEEIRQEDVIEDILTFHPILGNDRSAR